MAATNLSGYVTYVDINDCTLTIQDESGASHKLDFPNDQSAVTYYTYLNRKAQVEVEDGVVKTIGYAD